MTPEETGGYWCHSESSKSYLLMRKYVLEGEYGRVIFQAKLYVVERTRVKDFQSAALNIELHRRVCMMPVRTAMSMYLILAFISSTQFRQASPRMKYYSVCTGSKHI